MTRKLPWSQGLSSQEELRIQNSELPGIMDSEMDTSVGTHIDEVQIWRWSRDAEASAAEWNSGIRRWYCYHTHRMLNLSGLLSRKWRPRLEATRRRPACSEEQTPGRTSTCRAPGRCATAPRGQRVRLWACPSRQADTRAETRPGSAGDTPEIVVRACSGR